MHLRNQPVREKLRLKSNFLRTLNPATEPGLKFLSQLQKTSSNLPLVFTVRSNPTECQEEPCYYFFKDHPHFSENEDRVEQDIASLIRFALFLFLSYFLKGITIINICFSKLVFLSRGLLIQRPFCPLSLSGYQMKQDVLFPNLTDNSAKLKLRMFGKFQVRCTKGSIY